MNGRSVARAAHTAVALTVNLTIAAGTQRSDYTAISTQLTSGRAELARCRQRLQDIWSSALKR